MNDPNESLSQYDENHVVPTPLSGIRVGGRLSIISILSMLLLSLRLI
jgi:hypothetical protein